MKQINGHNIAENLYNDVMILIKAAWSDGFNLTVGGGTRTFDEQLALRKKHVIDKTKENDIEYLKTADNGLFYPRTAKPGTSNHEQDKKGNAKAIDFNVTGMPEVYRWLVLNAHKYGWIRTVPSERWHWEKRLGGMFDFVPQNHPTWDNLV